MKDIALIIKNEWTCFVKSEKGIFVIYGVLVLAWSFLLSHNAGAVSSETGYLWLVFFSVIVSGNFANTTFVSERMSGSLEILLTSGISRSAILSGKILFVMGMSGFMGVVCFGTASGFGGLQGKEITGLAGAPAAAKELMLYCAACFMNASCGAWLSVRITNPRLLHFINLFVLGVIVILHSVLSYFIALTLWSLVFALVVLGAVFYFRAQRDFRTERVIQPVVY